MENSNLNTISELFDCVFGYEPDTITPLSSSGSNRRYYRLTSGSESVIGAYNEDLKENKAFLGFTWHFLSKGLNVPFIYGQDLDQNVYLLQDLGDTTLFSQLSALRNQPDFPEALLQQYKQVIDALPGFQVNAGRDLDYSLCYPRASFDKQSMLWDLSYFKYYFLKLAKVPFDEQALEDDFSTFTNLLLKAENDFFMYRDFQSRNIMIYNDLPYFIDYQGGRKGALQYDLASLLFDAKADLPVEMRNELLDYYLSSIGKYLKIDSQRFLDAFYPFVYIRIIQAMGAYGFRGFYEKKEHFLQSIPFALNNLRWLLDKHPLPTNLPALQQALEGIAASDFLKKFSAPRLTISINSFSYHKSLPSDESRHGGGFIFDCRALPNPGRLKEFKELTGKDKAVITYLESEEEINIFFDHACKLVDLSVGNYQQRNFTNLQVNFGCTGGQHRSVYLAERLATYLKGRYFVNIVLHHRELESGKAQSPNRV